MEKRPKTNQEKNEYQRQIEDKLREGVIAREYRRPLERRQEGRRRRIPPTDENGRVVRPGDEESHADWQSYWDYLSDDK